MSATTSCRSRHSHPLPLSPDPVSAKSPTVSCHHWEPRNLFGGLGHSGLAQLKTREMRGVFPNVSFALRAPPLVGHLVETPARPPPRPYKESFCHPGPMIGFSVSHLLCVMSRHFKCATPNAPNAQRRVAFGAFCVLRQENGQIFPTAPTRLPAFGLKIKARRLAGIFGRLLFNPLRETEKKRRRAGQE